jgi:hypothetical protein
MDMRLPRCRSELAVLPRAPSCDGCEARRGDETGMLLSTMLAPLAVVPIDRAPCRDERPSRLVGR